MERAGGGGGGGGWWRGGGGGGGGGGEVLGRRIELLKIKSVLSILFHQYGYRRGFQLRLPDVEQS